MSNTHDPKESKGNKLWHLLENVRFKLDAACHAFDDLYSFVFYLKSQSQNRDVKVASDIERITKQTDF